jgi:hypothetical protein
VRLPEDAEVLAGRDGDGIVVAMAAAGRRRGVRLTFLFPRRLAKIKKIHIHASSSYRYTTCMLMSTFIIGNTSNTSLPKLTCYPYTMRSSR